MKCITKEVLWVVIKKTRLNLAGHGVRMCDIEIPNRITNYNRVGEKILRRPKTSLMDVDVDVRKAGVRHWRKEDEDRNGWREIIEDTKTQMRIGWWWWWWWLWWWWWWWWWWLWWWWWWWWWLWLWNFNGIFQRLAISPDLHLKRTFPEQYLLETEPNCS